MKTIIKLINKELNIIDLHLNNLFVNKQTEMYAHLSDFIQRPSKRIRSMLAILYLKALNKDISHNIVNVLCVGELIHNASLLHDDVLDEAEIRRGAITLNKKFSSKIAILSGDFILALATQKLIQLNNLEIFKNFQMCIQQMVEAEIEQFSLRGQVPSVEKYLQICEGKTASLFETILVNCVILCEENIISAKNFAQNFGILFQLKNDNEQVSALADKKNQIYTIKDILGIEKTQSLTDNYLKRVKDGIKLLPNNIYAEALEDLSNKL